jgi:hypothetical protein
VLLNRYLDDAGSSAAAGSAHPRPARGPREDAVLALSELAAQQGLRAADIAERIDYKVSNTYKLLQSLTKAELLEPVAGSNPQRWRLASRRRDSVQTFLAYADTVSPGEWTTCADISLAQRGDTSAAWMVCWAAARLPDFPSPHRVLLEGGRPHPYGHEHARLRPGLVCPRLVEEGLRFDEFGRADRATRVAWDQLKARLDKRASGLELSAAPLT